MLLLERLDYLKAKLEDQILNNENYDIIYDTSVEIDKLLVEYYETYDIPTKS